MWIRAYAFSHFLSHDIAPLFLSLKVIYWLNAAYYYIVWNVTSLSILFLYKYTSAANTLVWRECQWVRQGVGTTTPHLFSHLSIPSSLLLLKINVSSARFTSEYLTFHPSACSYFDFAQQFQGVLLWPVLDSPDWFYYDVSPCPINFFSCHRKLTQCETTKKTPPTLHWRKLVTLKVTPVFKTNSCWPNIVVTDEKGPVSAKECTASCTFEVLEGSWMRAGVLLTHCQFPLNGVSHPHLTGCQVFPSQPCLADAGKGEGSLCLCSV